MDGNDNKEEKTREVVNIRMYHFGCKNGHILPTGQWYAPSVVINDALIMPGYARVCQSMPEYARVCQSMAKYARECQRLPESKARVCHSLAKFCQSIAQVIPKSSPSCVIALDIAVVAQKV